MTPTQRITSATQASLATGVFTGLLKNSPDNVQSAMNILDTHTHTGTGGGGGGVDQIGFYGEKNGVPLGTGTILNVRGTNMDFTISGTHFDLFITGSTGGGSAKGRAELLVATVPLISGAPIGGMDGASSPQEGIPYFAFGSGTVSYRDYYGRLVAYTGNGLTLNFDVMRTSAPAAATYVFEASIRRIQAGVEDLGAAYTYVYKNVVITVPAGPPNAGIPIAGSIVFNNGADMDGLSDGESFILRVRRVGNSGTANDDARMLATLAMKET